MRGRVLITGGAGFIGSHLADELLEQGWRVRCLDALSPQVHEKRERPPYLNDDVELIVGDVRSPETVRHAVTGVNAVFHFAAAVGVGQSMYRPAEYTSVNNLGTAVLLETLMTCPVERLIVASSMSVYGEGLYRDEQDKLFGHVKRYREHLGPGQWDPRGPQGQALHPVPTPESKHPDLASVYALSKYDQERMCLMLGWACGIPTVALRFFNVYGPRQSLSNPYTGVLAIFASRLLNGRPPLLFEDGQQQRDFVHVRDVVQACRLALDASDVDGKIFNIGSGHPIRIREVAERLRDALGSPIEAQITDEYRVGDVRHCTADVQRAHAVLGYRPSVEFRDGVQELARWLEGQRAIDRFDTMHRELSERGLTL